MEYEKEPVCHFNRQVVRVQKKRSLSQDRYEEGTFVPSKRRALSEEAPLPLGQDRGRRRSLSNNNNNNISNPRLYSALQFRDAAGQQPDAVVGPHCSSSTPSPATTKPGDDSQADILSSSALPEQRVEMSSLSLTKTMGTHELSAHSPVAEAPPPQQIDTVGNPDVGNPPVDASLRHPHHSDTQLETMNPGEQRADVAGPPFNAPPPPPSPQYHYSAACEPSGQDRASSAFRAILRPSPSPSPTQRSDIQLQPPGTSIRDSLIGHQQRPRSSSSRGSTSGLLQHTVTKPEAPKKSRLPPMGTFRAPPASRPARDRDLAQLSARNGIADRAGFREKGVSARKGLPTLRQNEEEPGVYAKEKAATTPKKRRQSQILLPDEQGGGGDAKPAANTPKRQRRDEHPSVKKETSTATPASKKRRQSQVFPSDGKESPENTHQKAKAPKRQRRDDKSTDKIPDAMQVDRTDDQPVHQKRQRGRWAAINTVCLEQLDEDENVDRVAAAIRGFHFTSSQSKSSSSSSSTATSQEQFNDDGREDEGEDDNKNTTHEPQQIQKTQEEEDQFYHDHAQRTTRDYGRARTITTPSTPKKHTRNSPSKDRKSSGDKGAVWSAFVDPLVREDKEHNLQLKERLQQRRRAREEQVEAQRREEVLGEKRRVAREKARERRLRKKEKEKEREEQQEMQQDQPAVDDVEEGASCSPDWLRLDQGAS